MFMPETNFNATDFAVTRAIPELHEKHKYISAQKIADHIGCSLPSVQRSLSWMMNCELVIVHCRKGNKGSIYEYVGTR